MKTRRNEAGASLPKALVMLGVAALGLSAILLTMLPVFVNRLETTRMTQLLANMRTLQTAVGAMEIGHVLVPAGGAVGDPRQDTARRHPATLAEFFGALTSGGYLSEKDLRKLLSVPGCDLSEGPLTAERLPMLVFRVDDRSPKGQLLFMTKGWRDGRWVDPAEGGKTFAYFNRDGTGGVKRSPIAAADRRGWPETLR